MKKDEPTELTRKEVIERWKRSTERARQSAETADKRVDKFRRIRGSLLGFVILLVVLVVSWGGAFWGASTIIAWFTEGGWPTVDGVVSNASVKEKVIDSPGGATRTWGVLTVEFRYEVDGHIYAGTDGRDYRNYWDAVRLLLSLSMD
jgi:hypothetical protein